MVKTKITKWLVAEGLVVIGIPVVAAILWNLPLTKPARVHPALAVTNPVTNPAMNAVAMTAAVAKPIVARPVAPARPADNPQLLDERRQFALGMIETGNNDYEVGRAGEVSRYQIMPAVWKHYSESAQYQNPEVSTQVARQHWAVLYSHFLEKAGRKPSDFDMYVLWNTRYGYYASKGFKPARLHPVVNARARFFVNLVKSRGEQMAGVVRKKLRVEG